jgi:hypothetical protein
VKSHTKPSDHSAVPLNLRNSNSVNSHSRIFLYPLGMEHAQKTQRLPCCMAQTTQKRRGIANSLVRYRHWVWCGRHKKHNIIYCCVLDSVCRDVSRQRVDQTLYNVQKDLVKFQRLSIYSYTQFKQNFNFYKEYKVD